MKEIINRLFFKFGYVPKTTGINIAEKTCNIINLKNNFKIEKEYFENDPEMARKDCVNQLVKNAAKYVKSSAGFNSLNGTYEVESTLNIVDI